MSGNKNRTSDQRHKGSAAVSGRFWWNSLSADIRKREFLSSGDLRSYDWNSWPDQFNFSFTWVGYQLAITAASLTAFITGIGQILLKLIARH